MKFSANMPSIIHGSVGRSPFKWQDVASGLGVNTSFLCQSISEQVWLPTSPAAENCWHGATVTILWPSTEDSFTNSHYIDNKRQFSESFQPHRSLYLVVSVYYLIKHWKSWHQFHSSCNNNSYNWRIWSIIYPISSFYNWNALTPKSNRHIKNYIHWPINILEKHAKMLTKKKLPSNSTSKTSNAMINWVPS